MPAPHEPVSYSHIGKLNNHRYKWYGRDVLQMLGAWNEYTLTIRLANGQLITVRRKPQ